MLQLGYPNYLSRPSCQYESGDHSAVRVVLEPAAFYHMWLEEGVYQGFGGACVRGEARSQHGDLGRRAVADLFEAPVRVAASTELEKPKLPRLKHINLWLGEIDAFCSVFAVSCLSGLCHVFRA